MNNRTPESETEMAASHFRVAQQLYQEALGLIAQTERDTAAIIANQTKLKTAKEKLGDALNSLHYAIQFGLNKDSGSQLEKDILDKINTVSPRDDLKNE